MRTSRKDHRPLGFEFDEVGNLAVLRTGDQTEPPLRRFGYDALGRLTESKDGATDALLHAYGYDATGNRTSKMAGGAATAYTYPATSHRLSRVGSINRWYDATGNTTSIGGTAREFVYDATNRLSQTKANGVATMNYRYNGKGERVRRWVGTTHTYSVYDEAGRWLGDYDTNGARVQEVIWLDDLPVGLIAKDETAANDRLYYIQPDHLGSPRVVIDPIREKAVWTWPLTGEAFGADQPNPDPDADGIAFVFDMRFPGQRYDSASGLNYNYFRDYEPATGRYIESDPVGLTASLSTYSYLDGMPVIAIDPLGLGWAARRNYRQRALEDQAHRPDAQPPSSFKQSGPASWFWCARMRCCKDIGAACPSDEFCYDIDFVGGYPSDGAINSGTHDPPGMYCKCTRLQAGPRPAPREPEVLSPEDMLEAIRRMLRSRRR